MESTDLLGVVDRVASLLPGVPRLAVLDAVDVEWARFCVALEPCLAPLAVAAAVWRLRAVRPDLDPAA